MKQYFVYIMANKARTLYIGITNNLERRAYEHKHGLLPGFTSKYGLDRLVYHDKTEDVREAIAREKQLKGWTRVRKIALIESVNPEWEDLSASWYVDGVPGSEEVDPSPGGSG